MGVEETLLEELVGIKDFQVKEGVLPEEMVIKEEEEVMMNLTLVMMGMGMIFPPPQTPLSQGKENRRDLDTVVLLHCGCISLIPFIEFMNLEFGTTHQVQMC